MNPIFRRISFISFFILAIGSAFLIPNLKFTFDFEQFFPQGDPDLEVFKEFREKFESDDNFLLVAIRREEGIFDQSFLKKVADFTIEAKTLPHVVQVQSLTNFRYPLKTPFTFTTVPAIHIDDTSLYAQDKRRLLEDELLVGNLISEDAKTLVVLLKNINYIEQNDAEEFMAALDEMVLKYDFEEYHYLGRPFFQKALVAMQKNELTISFLISGVLVTFIMFLIFRRFWGVVISIISILLGMLLFLGTLSILGRELTAIAALYPVLMIIVGTSDVIHIMSKYIDELKKGKDKNTAIKIAIREIGLATLLTSITTAIGFATLLTSKIPPIRDFGINAAMGVVIAYITVLLFTTALVSMFPKEKIIKLGRGESMWTKWMEQFYIFTRNNPRRIAISMVGVFVVCGIGISMITTNYRIIRNLPRGAKITQDFLFFEKEFGGFRPYEIAVKIKGDNTTNDFDVLQEINKVEQHLENYPQVHNVMSVTTLYKSINRAFYGNRNSAFEMPKTEGRLKTYQRLINRIPPQTAAILISEDEKYARITAKVLDVGADTVKQIIRRVDDWVLANTDTSLVSFSQTGTGVIVDKNSEYVRDSLIWGLGLAIIIVSILMAILFKNLRMLVISLVPNILPLLIAGGLIGFLGIELEAGVAIVFAIIFGIAVDDTIHFLSKYRLAKAKNLSMEEALKVTFTETGKAICLTTLILFFGFLILLFSANPPSVTIGLLISVTLLSALFSDLLLIPVLIRWWMKE